MLQTAQTIVQWHYKLNKLPFFLKEICRKVLSKENSFTLPIERSIKIAI
jgi:hypothetical protein